MTDIDVKLDEILAAIAGDTFDYAQDLVVTDSDRDEAVYSVNKQYKPIIKQLMVDEVEDILHFIDTDTNDVCWQHSPNTDPMIHASRINYLKEYIDQKIKEWRK